MFLLLALIVVAAAACGQQEEALSSLYRTAKTAEQNADYDGAARAYEKIISLRPDLAEAHANLGNLHYVRGKYEMAERSFKAALKLKPQLSAPQFFLGVLAFRSNDYGNAVRHLTRAAELDPSNPLIKLHLGYTYYAEGQFDRAVAPFESVVQTDERNEDAWYHLSKVYAQLSRRHFDHLQQKYPDSYYTWLARAHFFEAQSRWTEAIDEYRKALEYKSSAPLKSKLEYVQARADGKEIEFVPTSSEVDGSTIFLYRPPAADMIRGEFQTMRNRLSNVQAGSETAPEGLYARAEIYQLLSYLSSLWIHVSSPESYRAHQLQAQSLEAAGRDDEAIAEYRRVLELKPDLRTIHFSIGNIYWRQARFDEAMDELMAELKVSPNDPQAHYEIADILFTQGKLEESAAHYRKSLESAPNSAEAHLALSRIYESSGALEKSLQHLRTATRISPADPTPHYRMWLILRKQGKSAEAEKARQSFETLRRSGPSK